MHYCSLTLFWKFKFVNILGVSNPFASPSFWHFANICDFTREGFSLYCDQTPEGGQTRRVVCARRACAACLFCLRSHFSNVISEHNYRFNKICHIHILNCSHPLIIVASNTPIFPAGQLHCVNATTSKSRENQGKSKKV